jgi:hypothetical protein
MRCACVINIPSMKHSYILQYILRGNARIYIYKTYYSINHDAGLPSLPCFFMVALQINLE